MSVIHILESDFGDAEVWLDTEVALRDGLCIGIGPSRDAAVADAVADLEAALDELQGPPELGTPVVD